ncbi:SDR family oxidoreductase [Roseomonas gilardii]|uniref:SDR family oxidoreductase n=1 Tax=Roseomonas gilardii TaxID=257708 RepID=UPI001C92FDFE|nr:SDR family oxidoreductase [Roseomonas gilardii]
MAKPHRKPLRQQVIVLTGATSGIGLATARLAAERGASLVLAARNEDALRSLRDELRARGGRTEYVVADVADAEAVEKVAQKAIDSFGGFDSWVNNAGAAIYGRIEDTPLEDQRRLFDVNYWGVVNGTQVAAKHLKQRGGTIVNVGSVLSDRAMELQGVYSASKHAVKGITDAFRMEFEEAGYPISVTLVKPSSVDTLFPEHARNVTDSAGLKLPAPVYHPRLVAKAILHACEHAPRTLVVGMGGYAIALLGNHAPRLTDRFMEAFGRRSQTRRNPGRQDRHDNLYEPRADLAETGAIKDQPAPRRSSVLLEAQMNPLGTTGVLIGLGVLAAGVAVGVHYSRKSRDRALLREAEEAMRRGRWSLSRLGSGKADEWAGLSHKARRRAEQLAREAESRASRGGSLLGGLFGRARHDARDLAEDTSSRAHSLWGRWRGQADDFAGEAQDRAQSWRGSAMGLIGQARGRAGDLAGDLAGEAQDRADRYRDEARSFLGRVRGRAEDAAETAYDTAGEYRDSARSLLGRARGRAEDVADTAQDRASALRGGAMSLLSRGQDRVEGFAGDVRERVEHMRDEAQGLLRGGRRKARRRARRGESVLVSFLCSLRQGLDGVVDRLSGRPSRRSAGWMDRASELGETLRDTASHAGHDTAELAGRARKRGDALVRDLRREIRRWA